MGEDVVGATRHLFVSGSMLKDLNMTFIALIPKGDNPDILS